MTHTKLELIAGLEFAFAHNKKFKKAWTDYIELSIIEAIEEEQIKLTNAKQLALAKRAANRILTLFQADWWQAQGLK